MLVQSLVIIDRSAATAALDYYGAHNASGRGKSAALLGSGLYCLGVFTALSFYFAYSSSALFYRLFWHNPTDSALACGDRLQAYSALF
jgi:hypothetical protein